MAWVRMVFLECDRCGEPSQHFGRTVEETRYDLRDSWRNDGATDLCPDCKEDA